MKITDQELECIETNVTLPIKIQFPLPDGRELVYGPLTYNADGMATSHNCEFLNDPDFLRVYSEAVDSGHKFGEGKPLHIEFRAHVNLWAAKHGANLEGDFVECGVNTGIFSSICMKMMHFEKMTDRRWFLLDTYCGIATELLTEEERRLNIEQKNSRYFDCYEIAKKVFAPYPNAILVRGRIPDILPQVTSEKIAYLAIDLNNVVPEIAAGDYFWDRLVPGAIIVLDDYAYGTCSHICQKRGWDSFAAARNCTILTLPTGQGVLVKP
jgi:hypothetical protein